MAGWSDEEDEALREMYAQGVSASIIATRLRTGRSRNSVIGRIHRLKLPLRETTKRMARGTVQSLPLRPTRMEKDSHLVGTLRSLHTKMKAVQPVIPMKPIPAAAQPKGPTVSFEELERHSCRFPYGDSPFQFCGAQRAGDSSYCPEHAELCTAGKPKLPQLKPFRVAA